MLSVTGYSSVDCMPTASDKMESSDFDFHYRKFLVQVITICRDIINLGAWPHASGESR